MNLGYACMNMTLSGLPKSKRITTNRGMIQRTFRAKGKPYASELGLQNCKDLYKILEWNLANGFYFFRLTSNLFPWSSEYELEELPDYQEIKAILKRCGDFARKYGMRITTHPGPFNVLGSPNPKVVDKTIKELNDHSEIFDLMGLPATPWAKINIHVGGTYGGDFDGTAKRWCKNFYRLNENTQKRLTVENDDKASMWSTKHLYDKIHSRIGIPIVFDYHHHRFCTGGQTEQEALELAMSTWPRNIVPVVHYSQSRAEEHRNTKVKPQAHSDSYWSAPNTYGHKLHIMCECKHKELGVFALREIINRAAA